MPTISKPEPRPGALDAPAVRRPVDELDLGRPIRFGSSGVEKRLAAFDRIARLGGNRLLDVGCGNGAYTLELATVFEHVVAIDVEPAHLQELAGHLAGHLQSRTVEVRQMSAEAIDFPDGSFDAVTAIEVLEHVADLQLTMREIERVLEPGGLLYVSVPNRLFPIETHTVHLPGERREVPGRFLPLLPYVVPLHRRISRARNFMAREIVTLASDVGLTLVGVAHVMPPFDNWQLGRRWIKPITERIERSPLGRFGVSIIAVFEKGSGMSPPRSPGGPGTQGHKT
jgi:ubiquinone/menaquinone biosynthesis C-methylase UbiE